MLLWGFVFKPSTPLQKPPQTTSAPAPGGTAPEKSPAGAPATISAAPAAPLSPESKAAAADQSTVIENDLYRVELSNRGGVVKSWRLKKYRDHEDKALELVNTEASQQFGAWPFTIALADAGLESAANSAL
jgi:YidC/Oxa1 family membrane protein insertase